MRKNIFLLAALVITSNSFLLTGCSNQDNKTSARETTTLANHTQAAMPDKIMNKSTKEENEETTFQIAHNGVNQTKGKKMMDSMMNNMDKMKKMKMSGHVDQDFGSMMMEHHNGAVDMANMEIKSGKDAGLKKMAGDIIKKQQKEIKKLGSMVAKLQKSNKTNKGNNMDFDKMLMETMNMPMDNMKMDEHLDHNFVSMMKMHHQEGVAMAKLEVKHGMDAGMKKMAQNIIADQEKEIKIFDGWMDKNK